MRQHGGSSRHEAAKSVKSSSGSVLKLSKIAFVHKLLFKASKMPIKAVQGKNKNCSKKSFNFFAFSNLSKQQQQVLLGLQGDHGIK